MKCFSKTRNLVAVPVEATDKDLQELKQYGIVCMKCLRKKYKGEILS